MRIITLQGLGGALLLSAVPLTGAETLLSTDFNRETPAGQPSEAMVDASVTQVFVANEATVPASPFSPENSPCLALQKKLATERIPRATFNFEPVSAGVISFKAYSAENGTFPNPLLNVLLLQEDTQQIGPTFWFARNMLHVKEPHKIRSFANAWQTDTPHDIEVHFFSDRTYSIKIDGEFFPDEATRFQFFSEEITFINKLQFAIADTSAADALVFVDDVKVTRE